MSKRVSSHKNCPEDHKKCLIIFPLGQSTSNIYIGGATMKCLTMVILVMVIALTFDIPLVKAQFLEAGVEKFRVAIEAPDFTLTQLGGGKISLKDLRGKIILLNFFATY